MNAAEELVKVDNLTTTTFSVLETKSHHKTKHEFDVWVPRGEAQAVLINQVLGNDLWMKAMEDKVASIDKHTTFCALDAGEFIPVGHAKIPCQIVFDVKHDGCCKAQLVAEGQLFWCCLG